MCPTFLSTPLWTHVLANHAWHLNAVPPQHQARQHAVASVDEAQLSS